MLRLGIYIDRGGGRDHCLNSDQSPSRTATCPLPRPMKSKARSLRRDLGRNEATSLAQRWFDAGAFLRPLIGRRGVAPLLPVADWWNGLSLSVISAASRADATLLSVSRPNTQQVGNTPRPCIRCNETPGRSRAQCFKQNAAHRHCTVKSVKKNRIKKAKKTHVLNLNVMYE